MPRKVEITGLSKWFGELEALRSIDVAVEQGEFIAVVGPSGCGKTTFLRMVAGLEPATSGTILLDGQPLAGPGQQSRLRLPERQPAALAHGAGQRADRPRGGRPGRRQGAPAHARPAQARRPRRLRELLSAPAFRRHAPARQSRPRARDRSRRAADGRAVRLARRADPRDHADRAAAHLGAGPQDRAVRHPPDRRSGVPVRPRAGVRAAAGAAAGEHRDQAAAPALARAQAHAGVHRLCRSHLDDDRARRAHRRDATSTCSARVEVLSPAVRPSGCG